MRLQLAVTENESGTHNIAVGDVIVGTHTYVVTHAVHPSLGGLVGKLSKEGVAVNDITEAFCSINTATDVATVVEAIAGEEVPTFQAVVARNARTIHPRITASDVDRAIKTLTFVLFQDDIDDTRRAFGIIAYRRVGDDLYALNHVALQGTQSILSAHARKPRLLAVDEDTHTIVTTKADVTLHVDRHGRNIL